jgi:hypothetical protein
MIRGLRPAHYVGPWLRLASADIGELPICFVGKRPTKQNGNTICPATA